MNTMIKLMTVLIVLNIFTYLGVNFAMSADGTGQLNRDFNFHFEGDLIDTFLAGRTTLNTITANTKENWTSYDIDFNSSVSTIPDEASGTSIGAGGISFLDGLRIVFAFIKTLGNIAVAPMTLFFNFRMPVFIGIIIGIPWFIIVFFTIIALIRGVSD